MNVGCVCVVLKDQFFKIIITCPLHIAQWNVAYMMFLWLSTDLLPVSFCWELHMICENIETLNDTPLQSIVVPLLHAFPPQSILYFGSHNQDLEAVITAGWMMSSCIKDISHPCQSKSQEGQMRLKQWRSKLPSAQWQAAHFKHTWASVLHTDDWNKIRHIEYLVTCFSGHKALWLTAEATLWLPVALFMLGTESQ